ncbi:MAG: hypothetical protein HGA19_17430, partial [Oscillochloris sp.]|nr:hypothetical protein [Oscillochloris sp.]
GTRTLTVQAGNALDGQRVGNLREQAGLLVIVLRRNGAAQIPAPLDAILQPGDEVVLLGDMRALATPQGRT